VVIPTRSFPIGSGIEQRPRAPVCLGTTESSRAPSEIMWRIEGRSSTKRFESFPDLKKRYWGRHSGAHGYFCVTSKEYLAHHFELKVDDNSRTELFLPLATKALTSREEANGIRAQKRRCSWWCKANSQKAG